ncbi:MAG: 50S ribosomal protein L25 [Ignavibacteria bacterium]|jgi:large subunit ribosomal protein L25
MAEKSLNVMTRELSTKGAVKDLRRNAKIPGIFYASDHEPIPIYVNETELNPLVFTSEKHLISLNIDGKKKTRCFIKDIQWDPLTDKVIHFDLEGIKVGHAIHFEAPVNIVGTAPGVKEGGKLQIHLHKLEIEVLPRHMPEHLDVDISNLQVGDAIHVGDLSYENIKIRNSENALVVSVSKVHAEAEAGIDEELTEGDEPKEPEVISKGKTEEE